MAASQVLLKKLKELEKKSMPRTYTIEIPIANNNVVISIVLYMLLLLFEPGRYLTKPVSRPNLERYMIIVATDMMAVA